MVRSLVNIALAAALLGACGAGRAQGLLDNWSVTEERSAPDELRLSLRMLRVHSGGNGEARQYFLLRAREEARAAGYRDVLVLEYTEGIDSRIPFAQRVAQGVVRFLR